MQINIDEDDRKEILVLKRLVEGKLKDDIYFIDNFLSLSKVKTLSKDKQKESFLTLLFCIGLKDYSEIEKLAFLGLYIIENRNK